LDDNFFALGGDSLAVLQVVIMAENRGLAFPLSMMHEKITVRDLAARLRVRTDEVLSDGRLADEFLTDVALTPAWQKKIQSAKKLPHPTNGKIFITGATGFLGSRLLGELLRETHRQIVVLVRAPSIQEGFAKVVETCKMYGVVIKQEDVGRIEVVIGDIAAMRLGLTLADWKKLAADISDIYHCAAIVNMVMSYENPKATNVGGVMEMASLAMTGVRKKLNYASTLSVFVAADRNTGTAMENDDLSRTKIIYGGYAQSKWVAERFLQQFPKDALAVNIFRFGLITGDAQTGIFATHDYLQMFIRGLITLGSAPDGDHDALKLDVTPIDFAAKAMSFIGQTSPSGCYHVANHGGFSFKMILDALRDRGFDIKIMEPKIWLNEIRERSLDVEASSAFAALCRLLPQHAAFERLRDMDLFQATGIIFDTKHTDNALHGKNITISPPNRALLERYLDRILKDIKP